MMRSFRINCQAVGKVLFVAVTVALLITIIALGFILSNRIDSLQSDNNSLKSQINSLQISNNQLQTNNNQLQHNFNSLQSQYYQLNTSQNSEIGSLQSQLSNATSLIENLQGPTGILPTYMDLSYVGESIYSGGSYFLQLTLKNTSPVPITQVFVTLNSVQIAMTFTFLNTTVSGDTPLPSYQTTTARQNVTPPINGPGTYPLIILGIAKNGTIYTYQTTITSHI